MSIVIPAYNVGRYIEAAIRSALSQTLEAVEVVVVDDGSTDDTAAIVRGIKDDRLKLVAKVNGGLSSARNAGIEAAEADLIGFLDGDDLWLPDKARRHWELMTANPNLGLTYSHSCYIDEEGRETGRIFFSADRRPTFLQMMRRNRVGNGSTPVVRRACFELVGGYDEALKTGEDWEMWVRILRDTPFSAELVPEVLTAYRINTQSLSMNFVTYARNADRAATKMAAGGDWRTRVAVCQGLAMTYRITGTKALSVGRRQLTMRLLFRALVICPWLPLVDPRFVGTLAMMPLPRRATERIHLLLGRALRRLLARRKKHGEKTC